jgi:hypothetical protein
MGCCSISLPRSARPGHHRRHLRARDAAEESGRSWRGMAEHLK